MTALYFLSFRERRMVMVRLSVISQNGVMSRTLNVGKTKEMIVDFRRRGHTLGVIQIHGEAVEIAHSYKYLGTIFENTKVGFKHWGNHKERAPATPSAAEAQIF